MGVVDDSQISSLNDLVKKTGEKVGFGDKVLDLSRLMGLE